MTRSKMTALVMCLCLTLAAAMPLAAEGKKDDEAAGPSPDRCIQLLQARYLSDRRDGVAGVKKLSKAQQKAIAPKLVDLLDASNWQTVLHAAKALQVIGEPAADHASNLAGRMRKALERKDTSLFNLLGDTVLHLQGRRPRDFETVMELMRAAGRKGDWKQYERLSTLLTAQGDKAVPTVIDMARSGQDDLQMKAIDALREMGETASEAVPVLMEVAADADADTRRAIQRTLNEIKKDNNPPKAEPVRVTCIEGRSIEIPIRITDKDDLPFMLEARVAEQPEHGKVRRADAKTLVYHASPGNTGEVSFAFVATDGHDKSEPIEATVVVREDTLAPKITAARGAGQGRVHVSFSEPVTSASAGKASNYQLSGNATVTAAKLSEDGRSVLLTTSKLKDESEYRLTASNIIDRAENANQGSSAATFTFHDQMPGIAWKMSTREGGGDWANPATLATQKQGVARTFNIDVAERGSDYALTFTGRITIPADGEYTFYTNSDDGSFLWIDGKQVVDNGGMHGMQEKAGRIKLAAGVHTIRVHFFQGSGGAGLKVSWSGPGFKKQEIPADVLSHIPG